MFINTHTGKFEETEIFTTMDALLHTLYMYPVITLCPIMLYNLIQDWEDGSVCEVFCHVSTRTWAQTPSTRTHGVTQQGPAAPTRGVVETDRDLELAGQSAQQIAELQVQGEALSQKIRWRSDWGRQPNINLTPFSNTLNKNRCTGNLGCSKGTPDKAFYVGSQSIFGTLRYQIQGGMPEGESRSLSQWTTY